MSKIEKNELKEILKLLKSGDKSAFEELYQKYNKLVYKIAFSILKNKEDAEDIVQNVFSKIFSITKEKLPTEKEVTWLYSVTKNESINLLKKNNKNVDLENIYEIIDSNDEIDKIIEQDKFNNIISKLKEKEKEIVSLKILSELSFEEISKLINEPVGTVKWRYYKAIYSLRIILGNIAMFVINFAIGLKLIQKKPGMPKEESNQNTTKEENASVQNTVKLNETKQNSTVQNTVSQNTITQETEKEETKTSKDTEIYNEMLQDETENTEVFDKENEEIRDDRESIKEEVETKQEIPINEDYKPENNYIGIGFLALSGIFLIFSIFFLVKYQLKGRKKLSK